MADNQDEVRVLQRQIQRLGAALSEARSEVENLRDELARVSAPAAKFGVILGTNSDGTVVIRTDTEKIKAETSRTIDIRSLRIGQEILLNDNECGVDSSDNAPTGQVVTVQEVLPGRRVRISDRPGKKEIVAGLSADLADATLITGQDLLYDETSGLVYDLSGPSFSEDSARQTISFDNIGGMSDHVNTIRHLLDLAVSPIDLLGQQGVVPPTTILLHGPSGCGKTLLAEASATYFGQLGVLAGVRPRILTLHGPEVISKYI
jgi:proteasome-associated ATPase